MTNPTPNHFAMRYLATIATLFLHVTLLFAQPGAGRFELVKMGKNVNTHYHEAAPVISPDGKTLYFFVDNHPENTYGKEASQDIWVSTLDANGEWSVARHLPSPFNEHRSNQVFTVLEDGTIFVKGGRSKNSKGFSLVNPGGKMEELKVADFENMYKGRFYGASMSADKKHIIMFFSEKTGSIISDLYVSHVQGNGSWSRPLKLKLSHSLDDFGPFIAPDQKSMYYASARPGAGRQGGIDIYQTQRLDDTWENWGEPVNLGRPINTAAMDAYISMDKAGNIFTSRANSRVDGGNLDLFMLVPKEIKVMLAGMLFNDKTKNPIAGDVEIKLPGKDPIKLKVPATGKFETRIPEVNAYTLAANSPGFLAKEASGKLPYFQNDTTINVDLYLTNVAKKMMLAVNVFNQKTEAPITANLNVAVKGNKNAGFTATANGGKHQREISAKGWYIISASAEGFLNGSDSIQVDNADGSPFVKDVYLQPIEVGITVRLKNIYFDFDKTTLKSASFVELNKVVDFLKQNETVEIEISGHTDSKGSDTYNLNLSQGRSQSVVDYLIGQGIEEHRLTAHGYGEGKPIDTNDTDEGRANNRRVEFTILKK